MTDRLAKALDELPAAYDLLSMFMVPGSRDTEPVSWSASHHTRSLLVFAALDLMDVRRKPDADPTRQDYDIDRTQWQWEDGEGRKITEPARRRQGVLPTLAQWVRLVDSELWDADYQHEPPSDDPTVDGECAWLRSHLHWIGEQQWLDEIEADVTGMLRDIREVTGEDDKLAGKLFCIRPGCGWEVTERYGGEAYVCKGCGNTWGRLELHRMAERQKLKPIAECANLAGVSDKTLRRYKAQGILKVAGRQGKTELFDPDEVMQLTMNLRYRQMAAV